MNLRTRIDPTTALFACLLVALLVAVVSSPAAEAAWPGRNGPVVYVGQDPTPTPSQSVARFVATGLRSFDPLGAGPPTQLTTDPTDRDPKVSLDGRRIVFTRTIRTAPGLSVSGIFVANLDGSGLTQVTAGGPGDASDVEPTFYPSGRRIAFVRVGGSSDPDQRGQLDSIALDGSGLRSLTSGLAEVRTPAVSPTGRQIVFECRHFHHGIEFSWEHICSVRPDGSHRRDLTPRFKDGQPAADPDFSPSGGMIAFSVGPGTAADVFTMRSNGTHLGAFTNRGPRGGRKFPRQRGYDNPAFAPAGGPLIAVARSGTRPRFVLIPLGDPAHPRDLDADVVGRSPAWGPRGISAAASRSMPAAGPPRISLSVPAVIGSKGVLVAKGTVSPAPAHGRLVLQLRKDGSWHALAGGPLRRGKFKLRAKLPPKVEVTWVRAVVFEGKRRAAVSSTRTVHVRGRGLKPRPIPPGPGPLPPGPPEEPLSEASLMATVQQYASLPNHLSGTANSAAALAQITGQLAAAGLKLGRQAFTYPGFLPTQVALSAGSASVPAAAIAPFLYSGTTPPGGTTASLFDGGEGVFDKTKVAGKIVVVSIAYQNNSKGVHLESAIELAVEGNAKGLVAVTEGVADYPKWQDTNARTGTGPMPVLMVGKRSGEAVIEAAEDEENGTLTLAATTATACDRDVWGELEGAEPSRRVFVGVPASSFTPSASEHGSGVAILLGLARHYAALPKSQRPETLIFIAVGGHEVGWLGLQALIASPQGPWFTGADAYVHLGSSLGAPTAKEEPGGEITTTPVPDPTGRLHNSENPLLEPSIVEDFAAAGVPTPNTPPFTASGGEQTYAFAAGIPIASFSGASLYFHTAGDLPGTLNPTILARDAEAFRRSVDTITALAPGQLRAENTLAAENGAKINAAQRAPNNPTLGAGGPLGSGGVGGPPATPVSECP